MLLCGLQCFFANLVQQVSSFFLSIIFLRVICTVQLNFFLHQGPPKLALFFFWGGGGLQLSTSCTVVTVDEQRELK